MLVDDWWRLLDAEDDDAACTDVFESGKGSKSGNPNSDGAGTPPIDEEGGDRLWRFELPPRADDDADGIMVR